MEAVFQQFYFNDQVEFEVFSSIWLDQEFGRSISQGLLPDEHRIEENLIGSKTTTFLDLMKRDLLMIEHISIEIVDGHYKVLNGSGMVYV